MLSLDRYLGIADIGQSPGEGMSFRTLASSQGAVGGVFQFSIAVIVISAVNILFAFAVAGLSKWIFHVDVATSYKFFPAFLVSYEILGKSLIVLTLFLRREIGTAVFMAVGAAIGLVLIYWQARIGVWALSQLTHAPILWVGPQPSQLSNVFPMFDRAMEKPGYAAIVTIVGTFLMNLFVKRPRQDGANA